MIDDCVLWDGATKNGYGVVWLPREPSRKRPFRYMHRLVWAENNGPIPEGLEVRHSCDVPVCVNIDHLELGTHADNMRDMFERGRHANASKTRCSNGHELTTENVYVYRGRGWIERQCLACKREAYGRR